MTQQMSEELQQIIDEMSFLLEHPRIKSKRWRENATRWLPVLRIARDKLGNKTTSAPDEGVGIDILISHQTHDD